MPPLESLDLYDRAVLMEYIRQDDYGQPLVREAEEIDCQWEDTESESRDAKGNVITIDATVVVNREIPVGSIIWQGEIVDWLGTGSGGGSDPVLMRVASVSAIHDIKARFYRRVLYLQRFRGTKAVQG